MGMPINPNENIVITCGSTEAMMAAMMTVTNPGDKVVKMCIRDRHARGAK